MGTRWWQWRRRAEAELWAEPTPEELERLRNGPVSPYAALRRAEDRLLLARGAELEPAAREWQDARRRVDRIRADAWQAQDAAEDAKMAQTMITALRWKGRLEYVASLLPRRRFR
jgi:hypothetical protein